MEKFLELLLDSKQLNTIMLNISSYIIYIYPGIISIYWYSFLNAAKAKTTQIFLIKSFAISFLYNIFLQTVISFFSKEYYSIGKISTWYNIVLIIESVVIPYAIWKIRKSRIIEKIFGFLKINTSITDVPFELLEDKEESVTCLKVYLKEKPYAYLGYISEYEYESEVQKYIILTSYKKYLVNDDGKETLLKSFMQTQYMEKVFVKYDDIALIEKIGEDRAAKDIYFVEVCTHSDQT